jgi:hypothetical protein
MMTSPGFGGAASSLSLDWRRIAGFLLSSTVCPSDEQELGPSDDRKEPGKVGMHSSENRENSERRTPTGRRIFAASTAAAHCSAVVGRRFRDVIEYYVPKSPTVWNPASEARITVLLQ